jgi:hypothetical protein
MRNDKNNKERDMFRFLVEHPNVTGSLSLRVLSAAAPAEAVRCLALAAPTALPAYCKHRGTVLPQTWAKTREMENISRGPTFGDFVTVRTEASMQDVTVARLQSTRVQTTLFNLF